MPVPSAVETHPQREKIIDMIMSGRSVRDIADAVSPPLGFNVIQRYKVNVVKPLIAKAQARDELLIGAKRKPVPLTTDEDAIQAVQKAAAEAPQVSLFRQRLEKIYGVVDRSLLKAESCVRVTTDRDTGDTVSVGPDLAVLAPLLNQAHKNLELLGRVTGELEPQQSNAVSIQILAPAAAGELPRVSYASDDAIEGGFAEIGVLQRPV